MVRLNLHTSLDAGVRAYTCNNGIIHAKTIAMDGEAGSVGTADRDVRCFRQNFEANTFFDGTGLVPS
jgi:cardiolipin synthase